MAHAGGGLALEDRGEDLELVDGALDEVGGHVLDEHVVVLGLGLA